MKKYFTKKWIVTFLASTALFFLLLIVGVPSIYESDNGGSSIISLGIIILGAIILGGIVTFAAYFDIFDIATIRKITGASTEEKERRRKVLFGGILLGVVIIVNGWGFDTDFSFQGIVENVLVLALWIFCVWSIITSVIGIRQEGKE